MTVDGWDGRGLPPVARARVERAAAGGVRTSLLSAGGLAGLEVAGFDAVGEVLGTTVMQIGWAGWGGCGARVAYGSTMAKILEAEAGPVTTGAPRWAIPGFQPYARAIRHGRDTALGRMRQEAAALGADGVVGVRFTEERLDGQKREFMALGTAVRSRGRQRPAQPFTTDLPAQDVVKLLSAGWAPAGLIYGLAISIRHDDWRTSTSVGRWAVNQEVTGYTELLTHVRAQARRDFAARAAALGTDGALMSSLWSTMWRVETGQQYHTDHAAECVVVGNAIARFRAAEGKKSSSLTILPLRSER
ncbi:heavy metal-binding domain-containing protein [Actinoplanes sp. CA-030573]|uniref:heavy metal-binding domain-containing protein n=1 Tax=Actinoplanes sp. CA-030573 TaxID=3239898 RepID=UPI003D8F93B1